MPDLKAVLFDFGGVILTSPFEQFAAYEVANDLPKDFIRTINATNPDANAWAKMERSQVTIAEFTALFETEAEALGHAVDGSAILAALAGEVRPRMARAVEACHARFKTALLTNNFVAPVEAGKGYKPASHVGVMAHFDAIIESSVVGVRKPDPRFYELALEALEIEAAEAVFLDDLGINLKPARALGMQTIKVGDPDVAIAELEAIVGFAIP